MDPLTLLLITSLAGSALGVGYNAYTNYRDYNYQRNLQADIFGREDDAVTRRVRDLEAAGLNKNLAAGSAAQAGGIVSRSNTNDLNIGSLLDSVIAKNQIKMQEIETANKEKESDILDLQKSIYNSKSKHDYWQNQLFYANMLSELGLPVHTKIVDRDDGSRGFELVIDGQDGQKFIPYPRKNAEKNYDILNQDYEIGEFTKEIQETDAEWATAGKVGKFLEFLIKILK